MAQNMIKAQPQMTVPAPEHMQLEMAQYSSLLESVVSGQGFDSEILELLWEELKPFRNYASTIITNLLLPRLFEGHAHHLYRPASEGLRLEIIPSSEVAGMNASETNSAIGESYFYYSIAMTYEIVSRELGEIIGEEQFNFLRLLCSAGLVAELFGTSLPEQLKFDPVLAFFVRGLATPQFGIVEMPEMVRSHPHTRGKLDCQEIKSVSTETVRKSMLPFLVMHFDAPDWMKEHILDSEGKLRADVFENSGDYFVFTPQIMDGLYRYLLANGTSEGVRTGCPLHHARVDEKSATRELILWITSMLERYYYPKLEAELINF